MRGERAVGRAGEVIGGGLAELVGVGGGGGGVGSGVALDHAVLREETFDFRAQLGDAVSLL